MKNKILVLIGCLLFSLNIYASENVKIGNHKYEINELEYNCDGEKYYLENYLSLSNKIIINNGTQDKIYDNGKCSNLTTQDELDILNNLVKFNDVYTDDEKTEINVYDVYYGYMEGYALNTEEYSDETSYYKYNSEENFFDQVDNGDIDKSKINEYYVKKYFKNVSSTNLSSDKQYYILTDDELFTLNDETINEKDPLKLYEIISYDELFKNKKTYISSETERQNIISKNNIDENTYTISYIIINDTLYYMASNDSEESENTIKYYDAKGNEVFKEFNNKLIITENNYNIVANLQFNEYGIYDKDFELIKSFSFDEEMSYNYYEDGDNAYITFVNEEENEGSTYYINNETTFNFYIFIIIFAAAFLVALIYLLFIKSNKKKKELI